MANDSETQQKKADAGLPPMPGYNCTRLFLRLLLAPTTGWRKIRNMRVVPSDFERQLFYPLLALTAVCRFLTLLYDPTTPRASVLQNAIIGFVSVFCAYFAVLAMARPLLPPEASKKVGSPFFKVFVAGTLSVLDTGYMLSLLAPRMQLILLLGTIYTLYVACRGVKYLHVPLKERFATSVVVCMLVVGLPAGIYLLFTLMMPTIQ